MKYDIGMVGLSVMGSNLAYNFESKGYRVCGYDISERISNKVEKESAGKKILVTSSLTELIDCLTSPRVIMIMVPAGGAVDSVLDRLLPMLDQGDIIIDGGNSHFEDTVIRYKRMKKQNIHYIGTGVSGGEEGALHGPSLMPGGDFLAWQHVAPIFQKIAAKSEDGSPCTTWIGPDGAGHYVKMVHNGIEYGDMQLIAEIYQIMKSILHMTNEEMAYVFDSWNRQELKSYLIEITSNILKHKTEDSSYTVDLILDVAGQKGTGKWTVIQSLMDGVPLSLISESVNTRFLSSLLDERLIASKKYMKSKPHQKENIDITIEQLKNALYISKLLSYAQGFSLLHHASLAYKWNLNLHDIASIWRGGCIIRSSFLNQVMNAYKTSPNLPNLLLDSNIQVDINKHIQDYRKVVSTAILSGVSVPALSSGLAYFEGYTTSDLPLNLVQAMRDYFGAHTYERVDLPRGQFFHTNWSK